MGPSNCLLRTCSLNNFDTHSNSASVHCTTTLPSLLIPSDPQLVTQISHFHCFPTSHPIFQSLVSHITPTQFPLVSPSLTCLALPMATRSSSGPSPGSPANSDRQSSKSESSISAICVADQAAGKVPRMSAQFGTGSDRRRQRQSVSMILKYAYNGSHRPSNLWMLGQWNSDNENSRVHRLSELSDWIQGHPVLYRTERRLLRY